MTHSPATLLDVRSIGKNFAGLTALKDVSFAVKAGEIKGVIGPNGAGKTTLFNIITSVLRPTSGQVYFENTCLTDLAPHRVAALGIGRTFQNVRLFGEQSALENVGVGNYLRTSSGLVGGMLGLPASRKEQRRTRETAMECLRFVGLHDLAAREAGTLPFGQQRLLEMARALAMEPRLILLDEPAAGLNDSETDALANLILQLPARGITVLLVEHNMDLMMRVSDSIVVLNFGAKLAEGIPQEISANENVIAAYLGEEEDAA